MKLYSSFLIRCWLINDSTLGERSVIDIEHIQTGGHTRAASLAEAEEWIFEACRTMRASAGEAAPPRRGTKTERRRAAAAADSNRRRSKP
jgi:hypothetical protein